MATPINNLQPYLGLTQAFVLQGVFPSRDTGGGVTGVTLDMIRTYAFYFAPGGTALAYGQILSIAQNTAVFSIIGTTYGGNGQTTFALPNLQSILTNESGQGPGLSLYDWGEQSGSATINLVQSQLPSRMGGMSQPTNNLEPTLSTNFYINANGIFPSGQVTADTIGVINQFAGNFGPNDAIKCDGRLLAIADYTALFSVIGTTYGGDGQTTFAVPDLRGRVIVGTGQAAGSTHNYILGEKGGGETFSLGTTNVPAFYPEGGAAVSNLQPYLALTQLITLAGIFPSQSSGAPDYSTPFLGEIFTFAGNPQMFSNGTAQANGQLLPINQNQALFALLGTNFGGNGQTTFALPDLRGRAVMGTGNGTVIGQVGGTESFVLTLDNIPDLNFTGGLGDDRMLGGNGLDHISGGIGNDTIFGAGGNDVLNGGKGNDTIDGGSGINTILGQAGNDTITMVSGSSGSNIDGGSDFDTLVINGTSVSVGTFLDIEKIQFQSGGALDLTAAQFAALPISAQITGAGQLIVTLSAAGMIDTSQFVFGPGATVRVNGSAGADVIVAGAAAHTLNGGAGADRIDGGSFADTIDGGSEADKITGRGGADVLTGGTGNDAFKFDALGDSGLGAAADRINDYQVGIDRLNFKDIDPNNTGIDDAFAFIGSAAFGGTGAAEIRYATSGGNLVVQADADGNGVADMEIFLMSLGGQTLTANDFVL